MRVCRNERINKRNLLVTSRIGRSKRANNLTTFFEDSQRMTRCDKFSRLYTINVPIGRVARFSSCPRIRHAIPTRNAYSRASNNLNRVPMPPFWGSSFFTHLHRSFRCNLEISLAIDHTDLRVLSPVVFSAGNATVGNSRSLSTLNERAHSFRIMTSRSTDF